MRRIECPISAEELSRLYLQDKLTDEECAVRIGQGATKKRVASWRKRFGIQTLKRWERNEVPEIQGVLQSLLVGSMLGDGRLVKQSDTSAYYVENHSVDQQDYLEWKKSIWGSWTATEELSPVTWKGKYKGEDREFPGVIFRTVSHGALLPWHEVFYPEVGPKRFSPEVIDLVDAYALAIWYLDDGGSEWWPTFTFGLDVESHEVAMEIFAKFGLEPRWKMKTATTGYFHMEREDTAERFLDIIRPHVPACMAHKLTGFGYQGRQKEIRDALDPDVLRELAKDGVPIQRIARQLGVGATTVSRYLKKHGIYHPRKMGRPT